MKKSCHDFERILLSQGLTQTLDEMKANIVKILSPKRSKTKSADPYGPGHNPENYLPQPSNLYPYPAQPHLQTHQQLPPQHYVPQHQVYQPHQPHQPIQPIQMPLSPCPYQQYQCQPPHLVQSPQQSVSCATIPNQYRNGTVDTRTTDSTLVMNCQTQQYPPPVQMAMPALQSNQVPVNMSNQSFRCTDNLYYNDGNCNHQAAPVVLQVQNQQHQQQILTHHHQQPNQTHIVEQRQRQQLYEQHMLQNQQVEVQKQQQHFEVQQQQQQQENYQNQHQLKAQQHLYQQQQQQYSNQEAVKEEVGNGDGDFPLEVNCIMHETRHKELTELAKILKSDLSKLTTELEMIRKEMPDYSVNEERI